MNRIGRIYMASLLVFAVGYSCGFAADPDTFSPIVSYQFQDSLAANSASTAIYSPVVSYQFNDSIAPSGEQTPVASPIVSYQFFDWPGDANLTFTSSPNVSYYFNGPPQILTQPASQLAKIGSNATLAVVADGTQPLSYQWRINGVAITNAKSATLSLSNIQQANSGAYSVVVTNSSGSVASSDAKLVVYSAPPTAQPTAPVLVSATQSLSSNQTTKPVVPSSAQLIVFGTQARIDPNKMTIVLTHGWKNDPWDWPDSMAQALKAKYDSTANILAWDWHVNALLNPFNPAPSAGRVPSEGEALGKALMDTLGPNYNMPIHFIGHSLGTMVNCAAADYIHGKRPRGDTRPADQKYSAANTHMTLLDEAELVKVVQGMHLMLDTVLAVFSEQSARNGGRQLSSILWSKVIPDQFAWVDNYLSEVGFLDSNATNVMLCRGTAYRNPAAAHGYAPYWYQQTISNPLGSLMGHRWSFERNTINSAPNIDTYFLQNLDPSTSELLISRISDDDANALRGFHITFYPELQAVKGLSAIGKKVQAEYMNGIQYAGNMTASIVESFAMPPPTPVFLGASGSTAAYFLPAGQSATNSLQAGWEYQFNIKPGTPQIQQLVAGRSLKAMGASSGTGPVYTIIPIHVPTEAVGLSFEYSITGAAVDDFMTMGIGTSNEYTMEAKFLDDGAWNGTPVIPVSQYRNQDIQLAFALNGANGAPTGTLAVRNIQFFIPPRPQLSLDMAGTDLTVSWPLSAIDWTLETTTNLADPNSWHAEVAPPDATEFSHSMTFDASSTNRMFFRLRK